MHRTPVRTTSRLGIACAGAAAIVLLIGGGCNKSPAGPATAPTTQAAPARAPATMPATAVFSVNGHPITFEAPRVTVDHHGGGTGAGRLLIYSETDNAAGSFYFEMPLEGGDLGAAPVEWEQGTPQKQREDTLIGIESPDRTLQPAELTITAQRTEDGLVQIKLHGRFLVYTPDSEDPIGQASVEAEFAAGMVKGD